MGAEAATARLGAPNPAWQLTQPGRHRCRIRQSVRPPLPASCALARQRPHASPKSCHFDAHGPSVTLAAATRRCGARAEQGPRHGPQLSLLGPQPLAHLAALSISVVALPRGIPCAIRKRINNRSRARLDCMVAQPRARCHPSSSCSLPAAPPSSVW